ncbi:MAG: TlpA family protein disulfide reductase [Gammaproteobacteria bacterium]|nr:TlpA family protein disulfide reductase [Gammaproteobacteria bacterium]
MNVRNAILLAALLTASAVAGYLVYDTKSAATADRSDKAAGEALSQMRPEFSLPDVTGKLRSINEWDGKALIVNFWATWCTPCLREIPLLIEMNDELKSQGIQIIGIAVDDPELVRQFAAKTAFNYPILVGEQEALDAAEAFGADVIALPLTVVSDKTGRIIDLHAGEITRDDLIGMRALLLP